MERIGSAHQQMEPNQITRPSPDQMADGKTRDHQRHVERKKIGRQCDHEVGLAHNDMPAVRRYFEFFDLSAAGPGR